MIKQLSLLLLIVFSVMIAHAQNSYVYIEGIKGIPFNVISDGKEVPKLGKSYTIIKYAEPGEKIIDITFVNTNFSKQRFILDVQSNSSYGFRMGKTEENKFYLIDIVNDGKIIETNSPVNLALSTPSNVINQFKEKAAVVVEEENHSSDEEVAKTAKVSKRKKQHLSERADQDTTKLMTNGGEVKDADVLIVTTDTIPKTKRGRKRKIEQEAEISQETNKKNGALEYGVVQEYPVKTATTELKGKPISDKPEEVSATKVTKNVCAKIASDEEIKSINSKLQEKDDDEAKLLLIKKKVVSGCFTSKQVYEMAEQFDTQYGRYSLVKFVYPLTADPSGLINLDALFKYETYKLKLKKLVEN